MYLFNVGVGFFVDLFMVREVYLYFCFYLEIEIYVDFYIIIILKW